MRYTMAALLAAALLWGGCSDDKAPAKDAGKDKVEDVADLADDATATGDVGTAPVDALEDAAKAADAAPMADAVSLSDAATGN